MSNQNHALDNNMPINSLATHLQAQGLTALAGQMLGLFTTKLEEQRVDTQNKLTQYANKEIADIATLTDLVAKAEAAAEILDGKELDQLGAILEKFFKSGAVSGLLDSLHVSIDGNNYTLASVVQALAGASNVKEWRFSTAADGTFACSADFDNDTISSFAVAVGAENASKEFEATFTTADLAGSGIGATFTATLKDVGGTIDAGNGVVLTSKYPAVIRQEALLVSLTSQFAAYTKPVDPVADAMTGAVLPNPQINLN
jgi:hypothetical protein